MMWNDPIKCGGGYKIYEFTFVNVQSTNTQNFADVAQLATITNRHVQKIVISIQCALGHLEAARTRAIFR
jgi:hypothetical protein